MEKGLTMSTIIRQAGFDCEGCHPGGCAGHMSELIYQNTADCYIYIVDGKVKWSMGLDEMNELQGMLDSLD